MTPPDISAADFVPLLPAIILSLGGMVLMLSEVFLNPGSSRTYQAVLASVTAIIAGAVAWKTVDETPREVFLGFGILDPFSSLVGVVVCVALLLGVLLGAGFLRHRNAERGEFYALMLFATAGMSLLVVSNELITLFVSLEVLSLSTYALTAYLRRGPRPSEAGFKYFILGAFSSAVLLYGIALLYGASGTTMLSLKLMEAPLAQAMQTKPGLVYCAVGLLAAGFSFKVAAVPFHMWAPDVYEGAPTPVTALMSAGVKAAAFAAMVRVFLVIGQAIPHTLLLGLFSVLAVLTMVLGNLLALPQRNVKRMLAYSSIAHAGYLLLGVAALFSKPIAGPAFHFLGTSGIEPQLTEESVLRAELLRSILFYLVAYTLTAIGAFGTLGALERREDEDKGFAWDLERLSGLAQRKPGWAVAMAAFMLSLGGIPPTIGFLGKLYIFRSAIDSGLVGLTVIGVITSVVGAFYYLKVVVYMFMRPSPTGVQVPSRQWTTELALMLSSAGVLVFGILPSPLATWLARAGTLFQGR